MVSTAVDGSVFEDAGGDGVGRAGGVAEGRVIVILDIVPLHPRTQEAAISKTGVLILYGTAHKSRSHLRKIRPVARGQQTRSVVARCCGIRWASLGGRIRRHGSGAKKQ